MNNITIAIEYQLSNSSQLHSIKFSPDEYFDLDPDEKIEWDCVPYYNHAIDYLDIDRTFIQYTKIIITDLKADIINIISETFWNKGQNRIISNEISGSNSSWETIIEIKQKNYPPTWEILRYTKENNLSILSYHGLIIDNDDGSQKEQIIYQN